MPERAAAVPRWPGPWWWVVLVITVLPMVGAGVQRTVDGWYPESDDATITLLAKDTFSSHVPLVGMISTGGADLDDPELHHPGPLELYGLAPFARLPGDPVPATTVAVVVLNLVATATVGLALRRLGGDLAGVLGLLAVGVATWGIGGDVPASVWNPDVVVLPFAALLATSAVVVAGHHRWLAVQVVLASFVAQTHLSYVGLVAVLVLWSGAVTARDLARDAAPRRRRPRLRSLAIAGGVALVAWAPPLLQQVTGSPGNLSQIVRSLTGPEGEPVGVAGLVGLSRVVGLPVLGAAPPGDLVVEVGSLSMFDVVRLAVPFLVALGVWVASHRYGGDDDGVARRISATVAVVLVAGVATAARTPLSDGTLYRYYGRWMWPLGSVAWALLAVGAIRLVDAHRRVHRPEATAPRSIAGTRVPLPSTAVGAVVVAAAVVSLLPRPGAWAPWQAQRRAAGDVAPATADAVQATGAAHALVRVRGGTAFLSTGSAVALAIEDAGVATTIDAAVDLDLFPWGDHRRPDRTPDGAVEVWVVSGADPPDLPPSARLVAETRLLDDGDEALVERETERWRYEIERAGLAPGRRTPDDVASVELVRTAFDDPIGMFDDGGLGHLAARGLLRVPGGSVDDLYTLDRLRGLATEQVVRTYLVEP